MAIRLFIAEGHAVFREAVSSWLGQDSEFEVLPPAGDGCSAVSLTRQCRPDVVLMDAVLPRLNGIDATRQIVGEIPEVKVVIFAEIVSSQSVRDALEAGAAGVLSKHSSPDIFKQAIQRVFSDGTFLDARASDVVVQYCMAGPESAASFGKSPLTPRQREITQRIAEGESIKEIARALGLSPKTVDWHKVQVERRLGIESTAGLIRYAIREGLTSDALQPAGAV